MEEGGWAIISFLGVPGRQERSDGGILMIFPKLLVGDVSERALGFVMLLAGPRDNLFGIRTGDFDFSVRLWTKGSLNYSAQS